MDAAPVALDPARTDAGTASLVYGVAIAGGTDGAGAPSDAVSIYNAYTHDFQVGKALPAARTGLTAIAGTSGFVYLFGGLDDGGQPTSTFWRFDTTVAPDGAYTELDAAPGSGPRRRRRGRGRRRAVPGRRHPSGGPRRPVAGRRAAVVAGDPGRGRRLGRRLEPGRLPGLRRVRRRRRRLDRHPALRGRPVQRDRRPGQRARAPAARSPRPPPARSRSPAAPTPRASPTTSS